jgi:hypothetical protein
MRLACGLTGDDWVVSRVTLACDIYRHNVFLARNEYFGNDDSTRLFGEGTAADDSITRESRSVLTKGNYEIFYNLLVSG